VRIGVDIDGVLLNTAKLLLKIFNSNHSTKYRLRDLTDYDIWNVLDCSEDEIWDSFREISKRGYWQKAKLVDKNAIKTLKKLKKKGHTIKLITSSAPENLEFKLKRLKKTGVVFDGYVITEIRDMGSKAAYAKDFDFIIDDSPYQCKAINEAGGKAIIYDQPWNKNVPKEIIRAYNWRHVKKLILRKT
jgi:uncharacterized HAD superfamily protein